jgi:hypothetical protein
MGEEQGSGISEGVDGVGGRRRKVGAAGVGRSGFGFRPSLSLTQTNLWCCVVAWMWSAHGSTATTTPLLHL